MDRNTRANRIGLSLGCFCALLLPLILAFGLGWGRSKSYFNVTIQNATSKDLVVMEALATRNVWSPLNPWSPANAGLVAKESAKQVAGFFRAPRGTGRRYLLGVFKTPSDKSPLASIALDGNEMERLDTGRSILRVSESVGVLRMSFAKAANR